MIGFAVASAAAAAGVAIHGFVGSRRVVQPLLKAPHLPPASRWLMFLCWHAVTILLVALTAGFGWAASDPAANPVGGFLAALTGSLAALTLYVCRRAGFPPWRVPPLVLFTLMTAAAAWSILT